MAPSKPIATSKKKSSSHSSSSSRSLSLSTPTSNPSHTYTSSSLSLSQLTSQQVKAFESVYLERERKLMKLPMEERRRLCESLGVGIEVLKTWWMNRQWEERRLKNKSQTRSSSSSSSKSDLNPKPTRKSGGQRSSSRHTSAVLRLSSSLPVLQNKEGDEDRIIADSEEPEDLLLPLASTSEEVKMKVEIPELVKNASREELEEVLEALVRFKKEEGEEEREKAKEKERDKKGLISTILALIHETDTQTTFIPTQTLHIGSTFLTLGTPSSSPSLIFCFTPSLQSFFIWFPFSTTLSPSLSPTSSHYKIQLPLSALTSIKLFRNEKTDEAILLMTRDLGKNDIRFWELNEIDGDWRGLGEDPTFGDQVIHTSTFVFTLPPQTGRSSFSLLVSLLSASYSSSTTSTPTQTSYKKILWMGDLPLGWTIPDFQQLGESVPKDVAWGEGETIAFRYECPTRKGEGEGGGEDLVFRRAWRNLSPSGSAIDGGGEVGREGGCNKEKGEGKKRRSGGGKDLRVLIGYEKERVEGLKKGGEDHWLLPSRTTSFNSFTSYDFEFNDNSQTTDENLPPSFDFTTSSSSLSNLTPITIGGTGKSPKVVERLRNQLRREDDLFEDEEEVDEEESGTPGLTTSRGSSVEVDFDYPLTPPPPSNTSVPTFNFNFPAHLLQLSHPPSTQLQFQNYFDYSFKPLSRSSSTNSIQEAEARELKKLEFPFDLSSNSTMNPFVPSQLLSHHTHNHILNQFDFSTTTTSSFSTSHFHDNFEFAPSMSTREFVSNSPNISYTSHGGPELDLEGYKIFCDEGMVEEEYDLRLW